MIGRPVTRRRLITTAGAGIAALAAPAIWSPSRAQNRTLYVNTWGGSWTAAEESTYFKPFTEATGVTIRTVAPVSFAKLKAQVESGKYEWDVTVIDQGELLRAERAGYVEPIDYNIVDKSKLFPNAVYANGIAMCALGTDLVYRSDKYPAGMKSWADFWDAGKFPGPRSMINNPVRALVYALAADGVPYNKIFPLDVDRAFKKLDQVKPSIKVWWTQGNQSQQLLRDGEVNAMAMWNARASELKGQGVPVEIVWNGGMIHTTMLVVAKGAPNKDLAWKYIQFAIDAKRQAEFATKLAYGPSNPEAFKYIPAEIAAQMPTNPDNAKVAILQDNEWYADNVGKVQERFTQWLSS